ncbi:MAG: nucleotidyltransferase domain-containing protein [Defluviitaleaceae bacterium]|nr:nucleotidyltransferase domain-containing protein [Defluviitaleaceae bacterium]
MQPSNEVKSEISKIVDTILNAVPALGIYLFGSFSDGTATESSDYDFYVVIPDNLQPIETTWKITGSLPKELRKSRNIDMLVGTESKFNRYKNAVGFIESEVAITGVKLHG